MHRGFSTAAWLALLLLGWAGPAQAEWQIRPGVGVNVAQDSTIGLPQPGGSIGRISWGANTALIGNILGVETDFSRRSGLVPSAQQGAGIVKGSSVTTLTGNVILTLPSHLVEYTLRPYFVAGAGLMAVRIDYQQADAFDISLNMKATDLGGGVTGFLTKRIGLNWDLRRFRTFGGGPALSLLRSQGSPQLSFWRAQMALAIRY